MNSEVEYEECQEDQEELLECSECNTELERFQAMLTEDEVFCVSCFPDDETEVEYYRHEK